MRWGWSAAFGCYRTTKIQEDSLWRCCAKLSRRWLGTITSLVAKMSPNCSLELAGWSGVTQRTSHQLNGRRGTKRCVAPRRTLMLRWLLRWLAPRR